MYVSLVILIYKAFPRIYFFSERDIAAVGTCRTPMAIVQKASTTGNVNNFVGKPLDIDCGMFQEQKSVFHTLYKHQIHVHVCVCIYIYTESIYVAQTFLLSRVASLLSDFSRENKANLDYKAIIIKLCLSLM